MKDWCSLFPDRFLFWDWSHCCRDHDFRDNEIDDMLPYDRAFFRLMSDELLRGCVNNVMRGLGDAMYKGLRIFGPVYQWVTNGRN